MRRQSQSTGLGFVYLSRCGRLYCPDLGGCLALGLSAAGLVTVRFQDHNINYPLIIWDRVIVARSMDQCTTAAPFTAVFIDNRSYRGDNACI